MTDTPKDSLRVKPLVWHDVRGGGSLTAATTIGLQYFASDKAWGFQNYPYLYPVEGGIEAATSEAQADYEARILPLIETTPKAHMERYRHKKRGGIYTVLHRGRLQVDGDLDMEKVTVYQGEDGQVWVRPDYEFNDGRFEVLTDTEASDGN